jgi:hypothetical protein
MDDILEAFGDAVLLALFLLGCTLFLICVQELAFRLRRALRR